ncbi:TPA: flagella biosynthesis regulatory protein FliZ [Pluralibacter gergoviae]|nr:flagella biosynthesis regulatory protein FliZ [Pluralibacter gergoviae]
MHIAKKRPLSRYLKDFKHTQIRCAHCGKALDRITLVRDGEIINKLAISRLDTLMDDAQWAAERPRWTALCRFCGDLHCKTRSGFFDIIGFKRYLFEQTDMSPGTVREYVVRLRRLGEYLSANNVDPALLADNPDESLARWLPPTSINNYRIALRKYAQFMRPATASDKPVSAASSELY